MVFSGVNKWFINKWGIIIRVATLLGCREYYVWEFMESYLVECLSDKYLLFVFYCELLEIIPFV